MIKMRSIFNHNRNKSFLPFKRFVRTFQSSSDFIGQGIFTIPSNKINVFPIKHYYNEDLINKYEVFINIDKKKMSILLNKNHR